MDRIEQLTDLFSAAGAAHHAAFAHVNGDDPEWPQWYAEYLQDRLTPLIGRRLPVDEIAALLTRLSETTPEGARWQRYYAEAFAQL